MPVSLPGSYQWRQAHAPQLDALFERIMRQSGNRGMAEDAARAAESALNHIYHQTMVSSGGNQQAAAAAMHHHTDAVFRLAGLVPQITGDDTAAGSAALREARQVLEQAGISDPQFLYPWLRSNVDNDQVLRGAGLDPQRVRHVDSPWAHADLDGLLGIARQMLTQYRGSGGQRLSDDEISGYMDHARAYAQRMGIGAQFVPPPPPPPPEGSAEEPAGDAPQTLSVQDLNIPRRV